jgi:hypothetical protein
VLEERNQIKTAARARVAELPVSGGRASCKPASLCWPADGRTDRPKYCNRENPKGRYRDRKRPSLDPVLSQRNVVHTLTSLVTRIIFFCINCTRSFRLKYLSLFLLNSAVLKHHHHQWRYSPELILDLTYGFRDRCILRCGLSAPRSTYSSHPDSTTRDI